MNKNKLLDWYARYIWPFVRRFVRLSKRCHTCLLSEHYTELVRGQCRFCREYKAGAPSDASAEAPESMRLEFDVKLKALAAGTSGYHAALLLSGGKDSAYILHRLRQEYPSLKLLCITVNNGFMSPTALEGAIQSAAQCQADLLVSNAYIPEFAKRLREAFLALDGHGSYGVVDHADGSMIFEIGQRLCKELGIPVLFGGLSWVQLKLIVGQEGFELREQSDVTMLFPLAVWRTNEQEIRQYVRDHQLLPKGSDSPVVSNSTLITAMSAIDVMNLGYCSFEPEFAQLIREGKTDRKLWLHLFELLEFATKKGILRSDIQLAISRLGLTLEDVVKKPLGKKASISHRSDGVRRS